MQCQFTHWAKAFPLLYSDLLRAGSWTGTHQRLATQSSKPHTFHLHFSKQRSHVLLATGHMALFLINILPSTGSMILSLLPITPHAQPFPSGVMGLGASESWAVVTVTPARITFSPLGADSAQLLSWLYLFFPYLGSSAKDPHGSWIVHSLCPLSMEHPSSKLC